MSARLQNRGWTDLIVAVVLSVFCFIQPSAAWDAHGHVVVTQLAVERLPSDFPEWVRMPDRVDRLAYLSVEPDRWRGQKAPILNHINNPDHYFDVEDLTPYGLNLLTLPRFRNQFIEHLATRRAEESDRFRKHDPEKDRNYVYTVPGMLPYAIVETRWKISASWTTLRTFERYVDVATPEEIQAARDLVIHHMGILSHYVGDAAQPLHMTRHHNGWVGPNPHGYTTSKTFHAYIDGGVLTHHGIAFEDLRARALPPSAFDPENEWPQLLACLTASHSRVEPLYRLEKTGALKEWEGKQFIEECLLEGGGNLAGLWVAAHQSSRVDDFLAYRLEQRRKERKPKTPAAAAANDKRTDPEPAPSLSAPDS
jgi:hypothetical protein